MKKVKRIDDNELNSKAIEILRIANKAVFQAKAENKRLGIPEYFMKSGQLYFVLPSGEITTEIPEIMKGKKPLE